MRDECLKEIYDCLSPDARKVLAVLTDAPEGHSLEGLMQAARLSTHRMRLALSELCGATLVRRMTGKPAYLTANGRRLQVLLGRGCAK